MASSKQLIQAAAGVSTGPEGAWDLTYSYYAETGNEWTASSAGTNIGSTSLPSWPSGYIPEGLTFKPDGTAFFVTNSGNQRIYEYSLSTPWILSTRAYVNAHTMPTPHDWRGIAFKPDGTKVFTVTTNGDDVHEWALSTAWDLTTATYTTNKTVNAQDATPNQLTFKPDGTKMYIVGHQNDKTFEYDLSTAWDVSTATYNSKSLTTSRDGYGIAFKPDGTRVFYQSYQSTTSQIRQWNLSTAWDISTGSSVSQSNLSANTKGLYIHPDGNKFFVLYYAGSSALIFSYLMGPLYAASDSAVRGIEWKPEGDKFYYAGDSGNRVYQVNLGGGFSVQTQDGLPTQVAFKSDGTKMYILGQQYGYISEYDLSTAWDATTASYLQNFQVSGTTGTPKGMFFKPDGTKVFVCGQGQTVGEYDLSTAWDITTASYVQNFSTSSQDTSPDGLFFKPDGSKMYIMGGTNDTVFQYSLSTAWDVSTVSYDSVSFSVATQETSSTEIFFKSDGTKMYVTGYINNDVFEYDLSTAWDISSASYSQSLDINTATGETVSMGMSFKSDGSKLYVVGWTKDQVFTFDLSTAWDVSTGSFGISENQLWDLNSVLSTSNISVTTQGATPNDIFFKPDGTKMFLITDDGTNILGEWHLSTAWDVTTGTFMAQNTSISTQETNPQALAFKDDGTKVYIAGTSSDSVHEYDLSTAWSISSITLNQSLSVSTYAPNPLSLRFKSDGKKMYVGSSTSVQEYELSTAWDISTATHIAEADLATYPASIVPYGLTFKDDGTKYWVSNGTSIIYAYNLAPQE